MGSGVDTLRGVIIRRYRGIDRIDLPLRPMTMLVGRNSAGKSNVLQALGHEPFAAGEEERAHDPPPELSWVHLAPNEWSPKALFRTQLGQSGVDSDGAEQVARYLSRQGPLLVWSSGDDLLVGMSRLDVDRLGLLRCMAEHDVPRLDWLDELAGSPVGGGHLFAPIGPVTERVEAPVVVPKTVYVDADDITQHLTRRVRDVTAACLGRLARVDEEVAEALAAFDAGRIAPLDGLGLLRPILARLETDANALAPRFLKEHGVIRISVDRGPDDALGRVRELLASARQALETGGIDGESHALIDEALRLIGEHGDTFDLHLDSLLIESSSPSADRPYSRLGQGTRRWVAASLAEAADRLEAFVLADGRFASPDAARAAVIELDPDAATPPKPVPIDPSGAGLRLLDEPGESLHPTAQRDVLAWLEDRVAEGDLVVFSAHQPAMIHSSTHPDQVMVIGIQRRQGRTVPVYMPGSLLEDLESNTSELGITRTELLLQARGLLLVEGADDAAVLQRLYGEELARRSIVMHSIGGSHRRAVVDLLESPLFRLLDVPVWVMFDRSAPSGGTKSSELRAIQEILDHCEGDDFPAVRSIPFEPPDIVCGFRPGVVRSVFPTMLLDTWPRTVNTWARTQANASAQGPTFKTWLKARVGLSSGSSFSQLVIEPLLAVANGGPADASEWLQSAMDHLFDDLTTD